MEISPYCLLSLLPIFLLSGFSLSCKSPHFLIVEMISFFSISCSLYENETTLEISLKSSLDLNVQMVNLILTQPQAELFFKQRQVKIMPPNL